MRIVVQIQENDQGPPSVFLLEPSYPRGRVGHRLSFDDLAPLLALRDGTPLANVVALAGRELFAAIARHPAINTALSIAALQPAPAYVPIYLFVDPADEEAMPWEALYDTGTFSGFLALNDRWPIARLRDPFAVPRLDWDFAPPLEIMAILSAPGDSPQTQLTARDEWERLRDVLLAYGGDFRLELLVCEQELENEVNGLGDARFRATYIADKASLLRRIETVGPQVVHIFSHATADSPAHLRIGTRQDWEIGRPGSILIEAGELRRADRQSEVWVLTLSCCETATQVRGARGLASALVTAGFPVVVGMRDRIASSSAHRFCGPFYRRVLDLIDEARPGGPVVELEVARALWEARGVLCDDCRPGYPQSQIAPDCTEWTIPVLYTRLQPIRIRRITAPHVPGPGSVQALAEITELQTQRDRIAAMAIPEPTRTQMLAEFDTQLDVLRRKLQ